jgi:hypothetical protein
MTYPFGDATYNVQVSYRTWSKGRVVKHIQIKASDASLAKLLAIKKVVRTRDAFEVAAEIAVA